MNLIPFLFVGMCGIMLSIMSICINYFTNKKLDWPITSYYLGIAIALSQIIAFIGFAIHHN